MSTEPRDPELDRLAEALAGLIPATRAVDRDRLLFRAGQLSAARKTRLWAGASMVLATSTTVFALLFVQRPAARVEQQFVYVPAVEPVSRATERVTPIAEERPATPVTLAREDGQTCYQMEQLVLRWGVDALPVQPASAEVSLPQRTQSAWWPDRVDGSALRPVRTP
jgi:hypothetical protein